jgi:hypothetical protein
MQLFINPKDTVRLTLFDGQHWIDVKKRLSVKETKDIQAAGITHMSARASQESIPEDQREVKMGLDMGRLSLARAEKYVVGWSFTLGEAPVAVTPQAISDLLPEVFDAIDVALDAHIKEQEAEKKAKTGGTTAPSE